MLVADVSDTTYPYDRDQKYLALARAGIPVYWIVNLPARSIEVHTDPGPEGYATQRDHDSADVIPVAIDGQELGQIAVDDIVPPQSAETTNGAGGFWLADHRGSNAQGISA